MTALGSGKIWILVPDWSRLKSSEPKASDITRKISPLIAVEQLRESIWSQLKTIKNKEPVYGRIFFTCKIMFYHMFFTTCTKTSFSGNVWPRSNFARFQCVLLLFFTNLDAFSQLVPRHHFPAMFDPV